MKRSHWLVAITALMFALAAGWMAGRQTRPDHAQASATSTAAPVRKILYYRNPMGLADTSPVPKKDSMGMDYIAVFEGAEAPSEPGTVVLSPQKIQKLGVRTEKVRQQPWSSTLRASATVQVDETRQHVIAPRFEGWVQHLHANRTGMVVRRGQTLLTVYSPQLMAARSEYDIADQAARQLEISDPASAATMRRLRDAARSRLRNWDVGMDPSAEPGSMRLTSPMDAVVVEKPVVEGTRFAAGETILRLADLSRVWLVASIPASRAAQVAVGQRASFQSSSLPGETFTGEVSFVQPWINAQSRSLDVRVEVANPDGRLRPGLFGDLSLIAEADAAALIVPRSALLDTGTRQLVLVERGEGRFAPRKVVAGERSGEDIQILDGLLAGERVVVSANFLIDAESNLQAALDGMRAQEPAGPDAAPTHDHTDHSEHSPASAPVVDHVDHADHDGQQSVAPAHADQRGHDHKRTEH
ncbi:MAG: efflux RND transporter periplasmic adaptor subunit [Dokdonella sp.]